MSLNFELSDLRRRVENLIRPGKILEVKLPEARARVKIGEVETAELPWLERRAGKDRTWWSPEEGEQVLVLSPSGELAAGFILPAIYTEENAAPADAANIAKVEFDDGSVVEFDRDQSRLLIRVGTGKVRIEGDVEVEGEMTATGEITAKAGAGSVELSTHKHGGVDPGGGQTGTPV